MMDIITEPLVGKALLELAIHILFGPYQLLGLSWFLLI